MTYYEAARALERLGDEIEEAAAEKRLTPAEVAEEAGVPIPTVLALVDGKDIALRSAAKLLRWLEDCDDEVGT